MGWFGSGHTKWTHGQLWRELLPTSSQWKLCVNADRQSRMYTTLLGRNGHQPESESGRTARQRYVEARRRRDGRHHELTRL